MEEEVVRKKNWMSHQHFLDLVGATNLIPGPNSTEMTMHIGYERAGRKGLVLAGCCFILPAVIITAVFAWLYKQYGQLPQVQPFIYGIKPAIIAVIVVAMVALGRRALKSIPLGIIGAASAIAVLAGANEIYVLFGAGLIGIMIYFLSSRSNNLTGIIPFTFLQVNALAFDSSPFKLFLIFLKVEGTKWIFFYHIEA